ncbi:MAG: SDR family oxidoreductase [Candidatus Aenigmarchaeota archaeon]|nr:SDR family oxidoreductase [Candidatus Aenigmarchaeota archaeon]
MKILITGASGQLGGEIFDISNHENYGTYFKNKPVNAGENLFKIDLGARSDVISLVEKLKPDWVIHCAAATKVDWCESNKDSAWVSNVEATKNIVEACSKFESKLLLVSTDYVFDGVKGMYKEDDVPNPVNFYGKTKLAAERLAMTLKNYIIVRSSLLYSKKDNFMKWVVDDIKKGGLTAATDLYYSPTLVAELAECILKLIEKNEKGVFHTAGDSRISKFEFIKKFVDALGYDADAVKPVNASDLNLVAQRPYDTSLDISKVKSTGIIFSKIDGAIEKLKMFKS